MSRQGFTIVDMLIAVLLIGTAASFALPSMTKARERLAVRNAADEFSSLHSLARATAIRHGRVAEFHIDAASGRFWIEMDTSVMRTGVMDTIGVVRDVSTSGVTMMSTQSVLCFEPRGLAAWVSGCPTSGAALMFSRAGTADTVTITPLGKVLR